MLPELRLQELMCLHPEWVRQVSYYEPLHCVMSCATCPDSLLMCDLQCSKTYNMFRVEKVGKFCGFSVYQTSNGGITLVRNVSRQSMPTQSKL